MAKGIYKRSNSKNFWIRYADLNGRIIRESSNSEKFKVAEDLLIKRKNTIKNEKEQPEIKKIANHSFRELSERYLSWIQGRQKSAKIKGYIINQLLKSYGNLPLKNFTTALIEQLQTDNINRGLKPASNNKVLNILKHMFNKAVEWEMVGSETLKRVRKVKLLTDEGKRLRFLSKEECKALINACDSHLKPIVVTALNSGMRKGEILNLTWDNVDLRHSFILLDKTKNGERREIPINRTLEAIFLDKNLIRRINIPHVFYDSVTGKPYQEIKRSFSTALKKAEVERCTKCDYQRARNKTEKNIEHCPQCNSEMAVFKGIKDFHFHDLRHTFASHLVMSGVDITTVKELLGHKTLTMTLRYSHLAPSHKVKALDILDNALNEKNELTQLLAQSAF